jgi:T5SS/PEP-CTERM-associated repeat protein
LVRAFVFAIGTSAAGSLTAQNGGAVQTEVLILVSGELVRAFVFAIGTSAAGSLTAQNGGAVQTDLTLVIGAASGSGGTMLVQSGGSISSLYANIALHPGSTGAMTVAGPGSTWSNSGTEFSIGGGNGSAGGTGSLSVTNGEVVTTAGTMETDSSYSSVTVNVGTLTVGSLVSIAGAAPTMQLFDPAADAALTVGADNLFKTFAGSIAAAAGGPGTVAKVGAGTLTLTGHLTNSGGFMVTGGAIDFNGAVIQPGPVTLTAAAGTTIQYGAGVRLIGGYLYGPGTRVVTGGAALTGVTAFNGAAINVTGAGSFVSFTNGGTLT